MGESFLEAKCTNLSYLMCYFLDPPVNALSDYNNKSECISCSVNASFSVGGQVQDKNTFGHKIIILVWMLTVIFGLFGMLANILIIVILRKQHSAKSFEILLAVLAFFDLMCSVMTLASSTGIVAFLENWGRDFTTVNCIYITYFMTAIGRSGSTLMKVLIAIERYVFIRHPEASGKWWGKRNTRLLALAVSCFAVLLNLPRFLSVNVEEIDTSLQSIPRLKALDIKVIMAETVMSSTLDAIRQLCILIDAWVPFPLLFVFTVMILIEIKKISTEKRSLQVTRKKDIREVQMFLPVIITLFLCNIIPVVQYTVMTFTKEVYREEILLTMMLLSLTAAVNLPIYMFRGCTFRKEARNLVYKITNHFAENE